MENMPSEIHVNMNGKISVLEVVNYGLEKSTKKRRNKVKGKNRQSPHSGENTKKGKEQKSEKRRFDDENLPSEKKKE